MGEPDCGVFLGVDLPGRFTIDYDRRYSYAGMVFPNRFILYIDIWAVITGMIEIREGDFL